MAKKGEDKKLKRLVAPKTWKIQRKTGTWIIRPSPGPHPLQRGISLGVLLRDVLGVAKTVKEVKYILRNGKIKVDGTERKAIKFPVGFMDVISIPTLDKYYRVVYDKLGRLDAIEISRSEANKKLTKVVNKTIIKGGKTQLNLHDGRNILTDKTDVKVGDSLLISVPSQEIKSVLKLDKGNIAYITGGKHAGNMGEIIELIPGTITRAPQARIKVGDEEVTTRTNYLFIIGEKEPVIRIAG